MTTSKHCGGNTPQKSANTKSHPVEKSRFPGGIIHHVPGLRVVQFPHTFSPKRKLIFSDFTTKSAQVKPGQD